MGRFSYWLFGDVGTDFNGFEESNYKWFLDHAESLAELKEGLRQLSPFADDALGVAEKMSDRDFCEFKTVLVRERLGDNSQTPEKYLPLLIPEKFVRATFAAEKFQVPLGAVLIRLHEEWPDCC